MRNAGALLAVVLCALPGFAFAGAWTLPQGNIQVIETTTLSNAGSRFDANGVASQPVVFRKLSSSVYAEYGWNDWLTLVAVPEFASATSADYKKPVERSNDFAVSAGARVRLYDSFGVFSLQAMARSAGAFELTTSVGDTAGEELELRAFYGTHFELFGRPGCFDAQIAQRWTTGGRPNETPIDLTLLYDIGWKSQVLVQSFNTISEGSGQAPYAYFRAHKVSVSLVTPLWGRFSLQTGSFFSPAGQNALAEHGAFVSVWARF